jgi:hypothetical protein
MTYHIFIGYDSREHEAYQVCKHSIEKNSSVPVKVHKLEHKALRQAGVYNRSYRVDENGQYVDDIDGRPFSTDFTFTRFLVPHLWKQLPSDKNSLVMFVDCDFLFDCDIGELFQEVHKERIKTKSKASVYCVQHDYKPKNSIKMDNINQYAYNMKLWAAMMVFDMDNEENDLLTPDLVNTTGGRDLMNFCWIDNHHTIGQIPEEYHFIPNHSEKNTPFPKVLHWTEGGPWFPHYRGGKYDELWWSYFNSYLMDKLINVRFDGGAIIDAE